MIDENNSLNGDLSALPSMASLLAFDRAAAHSSFANAAKELGRTPSAISHAIRDIEDRLGVTLFERVGRSVKLTDAGVSYLGIVRPSLEELLKATLQVRRRADSNVIRISALPFFTSAVLLPNLSKFEADYPQYDLRLETSSAYADILNGEADIAIRFGQDHSQDLFCQPLVHIKGQPIASREYLGGAASIRAVSDLSEHTLIHVRQNRRAWRDWSASHGVELSAKRDITFESILGALDAVKSGQGIALAMAPLIEGYPGYGDEFVPVLEPSMGDGIAYNFVCRRSSVTDQKIQRALRWLQAILGIYPR